MSLPEDSLSGLAALCTTVDETLRAGIPDRKTFTTLQTQINKLQVKCPNHDGVLAARVTWFSKGLDNFEEHVVRALEAGQELDLGKLAWMTLPEPSPIIMGPQEIGHFLRRGYLKGEFPALFKRVISLYRRIAATSDTAGVIYGPLALKLEEDLLDGRL